jgi:hypothetical protein
MDTETGETVSPSVENGIKNPDEGEIGGMYNVHCRSAITIRLPTH